MSDPAHDEAFGRLVSAWTDGSLGFDKDEGVGLLWKEGQISDLLITFYRRAPQTMRALADRLADGAPRFEDDDAYVPRRLLSEFVAAMALPMARRRVRLDALELPEPAQELPASFAQLDPPMARRFRAAIEAWVDTAAAIEARLHEPAAAPREPAIGVGSKVRHATLGEGTVLAMLPGPKPAATVAFEDLGQKRIVLSFLTLVS